MNKPLLIKTDDGEVIINEDQISSVKPRGDFVDIKMSNGDIFECTNYLWLEWLGDYHTR